MPDFSELKAGYRKLWDTMTIRPDKDELVTRIARTRIRHKARYQAVEARTGVPWFVIAAWHNRESGGNFNAQLAQGDPLNKVSTHVPRGRGPFESWEDSAYDALVTLKGLDHIHNWTPERICFETERYNGMGYQRRGVPSPYLWSFSNHYTRGKYVADGQFDASHVDQQCGAIAIMRRIIELEGARLEERTDMEAFRKTLSPMTPPLAAPLGTGAAGGAAGAAAHAAGAPDWLALLIVAAFVAAGFFLYVRNKRRKG